VQDVAIMAMMPNKTPFAAFKVAVVMIAFFDVLAWLLLLGGISALEAVCHSGCRSAYGLPWFIIWYPSSLFHFPLKFLCIHWIGVCCVSPDWSGWEYLVLITGLEWVGNEIPCLNFDVHTKLMESS
jgi:hypothetical protein